MTHDSTHLGSLSLLTSVSVKTADGTLCTPWIHVSSVFHFPQLHL
jgi:hypothetical protein